jgi:hypothetical protein
MLFVKAPLLARKDLLRAGIVLAQVSASGLGKRWRPFLPARVNWKAARISGSRAIFT